MRHASEDLILAGVLRFAGVDASFGYVCQSLVMSLCDLKPHDSDD